VDARNFNLEVKEFVIGSPTWKRVRSVALEADLQLPQVVVMASWSKAGAEQDLSEVTTSTIRMLDEDGQKGLLFAAIRGET